MTSPRLLHLKEETLDIGAGTLVMGILNVTPDSFSDGSVFMEQGGAVLVEKAVLRALEMAGDGAAIIDVGGESTRPGSTAVPPSEEQRRILPVIKGIRNASRIPISVDTRNSSTAVAAIKAGASLINDVSGGASDPEMLKVAASTGAAIILMHMKGTPTDMQDAPSYEDVVAEVTKWLSGAAHRAEAAGVPHEKILVDPGIGFGKTVEHNLQLINRLDSICRLGYPVVLGVSRKAFIGRLTGGAGPDDRLEGSIAAAVIGIARGASVIRAHDVKATCRAARVADAILRGSDA